jgi:uncharacterized short protein YbdD (DUF466 family)
VNALIAVARGLARLWQVLRELAGETAYDAHLARYGGGLAPPPSREQFYLDSLRRKYDGISRCC